MALGQLTPVSVACSVALLAGLGLASGCRAEPVLLSDLHGDGWILGDLRRDKERYHFDIIDWFPELCTVSDDQSRFCLVYQSRHRVDSDGHDEVVFTFSPVGAGLTGEIGEAGGRIVSVRPSDPPTENWRIEALDLSAVPAAGCVADPADPCQPAPDQEEADWRRCQLYWPHEQVVLTETSDRVDLAVADTRNDRVLWMHLDKGSTCAVVDDVLDANNPDWGFNASVNSLIPLDSSPPAMLLSLKDTHPDGQDEGGDGHGRVQRWVQDADWRLDWSFPPVESNEFINAPHGLAVAEDHVLVAQALGAADAWDDGEGGSVTVLSSAGEYRFDLVLQDQPLRYARDVEALPDGRLLILDSGTKGEEKDQTATAAWILEVEDWSAGQGSGAWTSDGQEQEFRTVKAEGPLMSEAEVLYSAEAVTAVGVEWADWEGW